MESSTSVIDSWLRVPEMIEAAIDGVHDDQLDGSVSNSGMTPRETVHHLVEANIVAASMMIAALGASGSVYDWSWLWPNPEWVKRMGYAALPIGPPLEALKGLSKHFSNLLHARPDALACEVRVFDSPGAAPYSLTVAHILRQEIDHAEEHLSEIRK